MVSSVDERRRLIEMWQRLAWIEWYRSVVIGQQNRDFFWLTVLLFLTLLLAALLWGSQQGLLNKFVDVSVGYIEGAGIPIWVAANTVDGIDRQVRQTVDFKLYPYREVESFAVSLPVGEEDEQVWQGGRKKVPFTGWAVAFDDPLWTMAMNDHPESFIASDNTLPLVVILNRSLFENYFNCEHYINNLKQQLPLWQPPPQNDDPLYCLVDEEHTATLWLTVKVGENREYLPFRIYWQPHIPTLQDLAFLFPLSTLNTLTLSRFYTDLGYDPHAQAYQTIRVKQLMWQGADPEAVMQKLNNCFPTATAKGSRFTLKTPVLEDWVSQCSQHYQLPLPKPNERIDTPYLQITEAIPNRYQFHYNTQDETLTLSCQQDHSCRICKKVPALEAALGFPENAVRCANETVKIDMMRAAGSYFYAFAYADSRQTLETQIQQIKNFPADEQTKTFYIHPTYEDAHIRFAFVDRIMQILQVFYSPFFIIFLVVLLLVQIGIVISHRQHNYGIYLAKGISWKQIRLLLLMQISLSFLVAFSITLLIGEIMQWGLAWQLYAITTIPPYRDHIVAGALDLLPLSGLDYVLIGSILLSILYLTTELLLRQMVSTQQPAYLLS